jgi:hypothetical protein
MSNDKESAAIPSKGRARARVREATYVENFLVPATPMLAAASSLPEHTQFAFRSSDLCLAS